MSTGGSAIGECPRTPSFKDGGSAVDLSSSRLGCLLNDSWQVSTPPPSAPIVYEARLAQYKEAAEVSRDVLHRYELDTDQLRQKLSAAELERDHSNRQMMLLQRRAGLDGDIWESMKAEFRTGFNQLNHQLSETTVRLTGEFQALLSAEVQQLQSVGSQIAALEFARVGEALKRSHLESKVAAQEILASQEAIASQLKKLAGKTGSHNVLQEVIELQGYKATADGHSNANSWELQRTLQSLHASIDKLLAAILQKPEEGMSSVVNTIQHQRAEMDAGFLKIGQAIQQSKKEVDVSSILTAIQDQCTDMNDLFEQLNNIMSTQDAVMLETMHVHRKGISIDIAQVIEERKADLPKPGMHENESLVHVEMKDSLLQLREVLDQRNAQVDLAMQDSSQEVHAEIRDSVARCIQQNRDDGDMTRMHILNLFKSLESSVAEQLSKFHGRAETDVAGRRGADNMSGRRDADTLDLSSELTAMVEAISELRAEVDLTAVLSAVKDSRSDEVVLPAIAELRSDVVRAIEVGQAEVYASVCGQIGKLKDEIMMQLTYFQNSALQSKVDRRPSDGSLQSFAMEAEDRPISEAARQASQPKVPGKARGRSRSAGGSDSGESGSRSGSEIFDMSMHRESSFPTAALPGEQIDLHAFEDPAAKKKTKKQVDIKISR